MFDCCCYWCAVAVYLSEPAAFSWQRCRLFMCVCVCMCVYACICNYCVHLMLLLTSLWMAFFSSHLPLIPHGVLCTTVVHILQNIHSYLFLLYMICIYFVNIHENYVKQQQHHQQQQQHTLKPKKTERRKKTSVLLERIKEECKKQRTHKKWNNKPHSEAETGRICMRINSRKIGRQL